MLPFKLLLIELQSQLYLSTFACAFLCGNIFPNQNIYKYCASGLYVTLSSANIKC